MSSLKKTLSTGGTLALIALVLAAVAYATDHWARFKKGWDSTAHCQIDYWFNWGLYRYDSQTKYTCSGEVLYKVEKSNYELDCDIVEDENCDNLHHAQQSSVATVIFAILSLCAFSCLAARANVNKLLLIITGIFALIQMICAFTAVGSYSAIVASYSQVTVEYTTGNTETYDVNIHTGFSWALMLVSALLAVGEVAASVTSLWQAQSQYAEMQEPITAVNTQKLPY